MSEKLIPGIYGFFGEHQFLSNFYHSLITYEGMVYRSVEHAYQAAKTTNMHERAKVANCATPGNAKHMGRRITLRSDWEEIKLDVMYELVRQKFFKNPYLGKKLYDTGDLYLEETNYWNDKFWGVSKGKGNNHLGLILMKVRDEINSKLKSV